eukprot:Em0637g4a
MASGTSQTVPTLNEVYDLIKATSPWEDRDIQLELLTKLTGVAITQKGLGIEAKNYSLVIKACQHYWNACYLFLACAADRAILQQPLSQLLKFLESFNAKKGYQNTSPYHREVHLALKNCH